MDTEGQDVPLLFPGSIHSIKVFPFIVHLKRDVIVSRQTIGIDRLSLTNLLFAPPTHPWHGTLEEHG